MSKFVVKWPHCVLLISSIFTTMALSEETKVSPPPTAEPSKAAKHHKKTKHVEPKKEVLSVAQTPAKPLDNPKPKGHEGWFIGIRGAFVPAVLVELGYEFNNTFKLRLLGELGRYNKSYAVDGQSYNSVKFQPGKVALMADWYPWKNGFRVSGGIAYNADRIRLNHTVTNTLLGQPANVYGTINAKYRYRNLAPYLGLGYDTGSLADSGISLSADAGFWFQGRVRSTFTLTGAGQANPTVIDKTKAHLENLLNKHKFIRTVPMVSVGIRYLF